MPMFNARHAHLASVAVILATALSTVFAQTGYSGTIHYRDGTSIEFEWLGDLDGQVSATIQGEMGARSVEIDASNLREIIFAEPSKSYQNGDSRGQMIVVNRAGERFNVHGSFGASWPGYVHYVFQDPISGGLTATDDGIRESIASITIGEFVGSMRFNPSTEEFFPPTFVYDPYTGDELIWQSP